MLMFELMGSSKRRGSARPVSARLRLMGAGTRGLPGGQRVGRPGRRAGQRLGELACALLGGEDSGELVAGEGDAAGIGGGAACFDRELGAVAVTAR
jgi:hypothetical protein